MTRISAYRAHRQALVAIFAHADSCLDFGTHVLTFDRVYLALLVQHGPELVTDAVAMAYEMSAGLDIAAYLRQQLKVGNLFFASTICFCCVYTTIMSQLLVTDGCE